MSHSASSSSRHTCVTTLRTAFAASSCSATTKRARSVQEGDAEVPGEPLVAVAVGVSRRDGRDELLGLAGSVGWASMTVEAVEWCTQGAPKLPLVKERPCAHLAGVDQQALPPRDLNNVHEPRMASVFAQRRDVSAAIRAISSSGAVAVGIGGRRGPSPRRAMRV